MLPNSAEHKEFLSTLPVRGATDGNERLDLAGQISIHAPREGSDNIHGETTQGKNEFLSTLPVRGATWSALG